MLSQLLSITLLVSVSPTWAGAADDCGTVRLDAPGKAFAKIPVYNQAKNTSWDPNICYAVVAAQLRDAARFNQGDPLDKLSAPLSIALNHKAHLKSSGLDHRDYGTTDESDLMIGPGSPRAAIVLNNDRAVCDQKFLGAHVPLVDGATTESDTNVAGFLTDVSRGMDLQRMTEDERADIKRFDAMFPPTPGCRRSTVTNMESIFKTIDRAIPRERRFITEGQQFVNKLCADHAFTSRVPPPKMVILKSKAQMQKDLNAQLAKDIPVGIAYCHDYLRTKDRCPAAHTSVVVGRARRRGQCHYLLRDSFGTKCTARFVCEPDGSIWIPAADLSATASLLFYIPPGPGKP